MKLKATKILKETEKAILVEGAKHATAFNSVDKEGVAIEHDAWIPKSLCKIANGIIEVDSRFAKKERLIPAYSEVRVACAKARSSKAARRNIPVSAEVRAERLAAFYAKMGMSNEN